MRRYGSYGLPSFCKFSKLSADYRHYNAEGVTIGGVLNTERVCHPSHAESLENLQNEGKTVRNIPSHRVLSVAFTRMKSKLISASPIQSGTPQDLECRCSGDAECLL
jgi:hypothetical protein